MKYIITVFISILTFYFVLSLTPKTLAIYNPLSVPNNKIGIHILFPSELSEAAQLSNSSGGDWGYVTIPIQNNDLNLVKWQAFMDQARTLHVIPIIRLVTEDDYFNTNAWNVPSESDVEEFANFLNSLSWPTKNRYVIVYNEPNNADEWGGAPDPAAYARILSYAVTVFKQRSKSFFVLSAGLDNAAANDPGKSINEYDFMREMNQAVPGVFSKIDGISSHSYPNPGFAQPPSYYQEGIYSFKYEQQLADYLAGKTLPVFITETGWNNSAVPDSLTASYYTQALKNQWSDPSIVAITPFLLNGQGGGFAGFSFIDANGNQTQEYKAIQDFPKIKGEPNLTIQTSPFIVPAKEPDNLPYYNFSKIKPSRNFSVIAPRPTVLFFKYFLGF